MNNKYFIRKAFRIFVINSILSSLGVVLGTFVDAVILGNAFGESGLSVLAVALPVYMVYNLFSFAFGVGGSVKVAEALGSEDKAKANVHFTNTVMFSSAAGLLIAAFSTIFLGSIVSAFGGGNLGSYVYDYMRLIVLAAPAFVLAPVLSLMIRSDADPLLSTIGISLSMIVNLVLDLVFIFMFNMGMFGASLAMVLGQLSAIIVYTLHFFKKSNHLRLVPFKPKLIEGALIFKSGFGIASAYIYQSISLIIFNNILLSVSGNSGLAIYNILFNVSLFAYAVFDGISLAISPLIGTFLGEKDTKVIYMTSELAFKTSLLLSLFVSLIVFFGAELIVSTFGLTGDLSVAASTIRLYSFSIILSCLNCVFASYFQTTKRFKLAGTVYIMRGFILLITFSLPLTMFFGVQGIATAMILTEAVTLAGIITAAFIIRKKEGCNNLLLLTEPVIENDCVYETALSSDLSGLQRCVAEIEDFCETHNVDKKNAYYINLTIEELAANIISYGFNDQKKHYINIRIALFDKDIYIRLRDDATTYNPFDEIDKTDAELDFLGVSMIRKKAKAFDYNRTLVFNNLLIIL